MAKTRFAKLAIFMAVLYEALLIVLIFLRPDLPVYSTTISEWAIGKYGWVMQGAFFASAFGYLFFWIALRGEMQSFWGKVGLVLLFICFLGTTGVGIFVTNPYPPDLRITTTLIHTACGTSAMILLPVGALLISFSLAGRDEAWGKYKKVVRLTGFIPLLAFAGFIIHLNLYVIPLGKNGVGPNVPIGYPPRVLFFSYHLWLVQVAVRFINVQQSNQQKYDTRN